MIYRAPIFSSVPPNLKQNRESTMGYFNFIQFQFQFYKVFQNVLFLDVGCYGNIHL